MSEIKIIDTDKIIIKERYRKDLGNIDSLAESISLTNGNLVPILVYDNEDGTYELIAGERRLTACKKLNIQIKAEILNKDSEFDSKIFEVIENKERKDFTWQEDVIATKEMHQILSKKYGKNLSLRQTAEEIDMSLGSIHTDLLLADALLEVEDIFEGCKTKEQALKAYKRYKLDETMAELALRKGKTDYGKKATSFVKHGNCLDVCPTFKDNMFDGIISDPIYGIDVFNNRFENKDATAHMDTKYDDSYETFVDTFNKLIPILDKKLKKDAFIILFCGISNAKFLIDKCKEIGFVMDNIPAIWFKGLSTARTNAPHITMNRAYDTIIYGFRGNAGIIKQGGANVLQYNSVSTSIRSHPSQKPIALLEELISRVAIPNSLILDFMCGTGSTIVAGIKRGCNVIGIELDSEFYKLALSRVATALDYKDNGMLQALTDEVI